MMRAVIWPFSSRSGHTLAVVRCPIGVSRSMHTVNPRRRALRKNHVSSPDSSGPNRPQLEQVGIHDQTFLDLDAAFIIELAENVLS